MTEKCMMWSSFQKADDTVYQTCSISFVPVLLSQMITEQVRNQASTDKVANEVNNLFSLASAVRALKNGE